MLIYTPQKNNRRHIKMFHVKQKTQLKLVVFLQIRLYKAIIYYLFFLIVFKKMVNTDISAGLTPLILEACAIVKGLTSLSF